MPLKKLSSPLYPAESVNQVPLPLADQLKQRKSESSAAQRTIVIAAGHDACVMIETALSVFEGVFAEDAIAVTSHRHFREVDGCQVFAASHPIPNTEGLNAAKRVSNKLVDCGIGTRVIALVSDGASALLPSPVAGLTLGDKIEVNDLLLNSKLEIHEINLVRQSLSTLKGGGFLRLAYPAVVHSFSITRQRIYDPAVIGSGPSVGTLGTVACARRLLIEKGLFIRLPRAVREYFENSSVPLELPLAPRARLVSLAPPTWPRPTKKEQRTVAELTVVQF
ncbi:DUF4147 domain-containing protein [Thioclava sp.]|uniref:DUF4147 domain-containing protein n=1 Tax=Thioclava sp. TaxID=1933450 RepID=UPI003AA94B64